MIGFGVFVLVSSAVVSAPWDLKVIQRVWEWVKL